MSDGEPVDTGALVAVNEQSGEYLWNFGPRMIPFDEECAHCGESWRPSCVFETRPFSLSKTGLSAFERIEETGGDYTDVTHFAEWLLDFREKLKEGYQDVDEPAGWMEDDELESLKQTGGTPDEYVTETRYSGFTPRPPKEIRTHISSRRVEAQPDVILSLLMHAISFGAARSGELRSNEELKDGMNNIATQCHMGSTFDWEGVLNQRYRENRCWICRRNLPRNGEKAILGIACADGQCEERLGNYEKAGWTVGEER